ncbi:unnamed protein product [Arabis nemorensis]|uniref:TF-B3 domain-containing protein n=1 Tax=Arabis nemorensis TaxID=586526 RepID=A0A565C5J3_9BRAS|nr:unnamed protein product [Arabis nemorensis]
MNFQILPRSFVRANGLETRFGQIIMMNEKGKSWTLVLKQKKLHPVTYIRGGWRNFCHANKLRAGNFYTFKLIQRGRTLVLRFSPTEPEEEEENSEANEVESLSSEPESDEESSQDERSSQEKEKRGRSIWKPSSSPSQNRFVTVTVTPYNFRISRLVLPVPYTKVTGIKNAKNVSLLDKHGVKWSTEMLFEKRTKRMRLVGSWREFCNANCVEIGESFILELIWEADRSSVLKFSSKVKPKTK